jgi:hypothetical protein
VGNISKICTQWPCLRAWSDDNGHPRTTNRWTPCPRILAARPVRPTSTRSSPTTSGPPASYAAGRRKRPTSLGLVRFPRPATTGPSTTPPTSSASSTASSSGAKTQLEPVYDRLRQLGIDEPTDVDRTVENLTGRPSRARQTSYRESRKQLLLALLDEMHRRCRPGGRRNRHLLRPPPPSRHPRSCR